MHTIPNPRGWNDLLRADGVDFEEHGFSDEDAVAKWDVMFPYGKMMEISAHTTCRERGERYGFLNAEAMLLDKEGHQLVFTEPRRALDGDWELCALDGNKYIASFMGINH